MTNAQKQIQKIRQQIAAKPTGGKIGAIDGLSPIAQADGLVQRMEFDTADQLLEREIF